MKYAAVFFCAVLGAAAVFAGGGEQKAIAKAGRIRVGVKSDVPGFGLLNAKGDYEGLEIEIARLVAREMLGSGSRAVFTTVSTRSRGPLLKSGEVDIVVATYTATDERKKEFNFTSPYYTDSVGILVKKDAGISGLADFAGKTVGVLQGATSRKALEDAAKARGLALNYAEFATFPEIKTALVAGRVQGFAVDKPILRAYLDEGTEILPDSFAPQDYGIASRLADKKFAAYLDGLVKKWKSDGTLDALVKKFNL
jgi:putative glutamine transport system substrate-binding protein